MSQRPKKGVEEDNTSGAMTPPTSPPHDTFSATEGEGEAVFAGKPIARSILRKSAPRNDDNQDEKTKAKRQRMCPDKHFGQPLPPSTAENKIGVSSVAPPQPRSKNDKTEKAKDEKQQPAAPPQPPPPPRRRQSNVAPPPPPPKGPPSRKLPRPPPPPPPSGISSMKRPPPRPNQGPTTSQKPPPPTKVPVPPPPSKQVNHSKRQPSISEASVDLISPDVKPHVNLPPGWICVWSKSQKRWYFFNTKNNKSVWQWPPP